MIAGVGVGDRGREERDADRQHDQVEHVRPSAMAENETRYLIFRRKPPRAVVDPADKRQRHRVNIGIS